MGVDEILVHISGPSSKKDDQRFRSMARAYGAFRTATTTRGLPLDETEPYIDGGARLNPQHDASKEGPSPAVSSMISSSEPRAARKRCRDTADQSHCGIPNDNPNLADYIDDTQLARAVISSQLWSDSLDEEASQHSSSPLARGARKRRQIDRFTFSGDDRETAVADPQDPQSIPSNELSRVIESFESTREADPSATSANGCENRYPDVKRASVARQGIRSSKTLDETLREVDALQPTSNCRPRSEEPTAALPCGVAIANDHARSTDLASLEINGDTSPDHHHQLLPQLMSKTAAGTAGLHSPLHYSTRSRTEPASMPRRLHTKDAVHASKDEAVFPPNMDVSILPTPSAEDLLNATPALVKLNANPALSTVYKPHLHARHVNDFERGHWRVPVSSLTQQARDAMWSFLTRFIRDGHGGWGLWCTKDEHGYFRLYCWGCAVSHAYHLLYVASKSKIRGCFPVEWIDAEAKVVIEIGSNY